MTMVQLNYKKFVSDTLGVIRMAMITGILIYAFVYVIWTLMEVPEEDWEK